MIAGKNVKVYIIFHRSNGIDISDLEHIRLAGKGGAGSVHLVRERHTRKQYAVKVIQRKSGRSIEASNVVQSEFLVVGQMDHPNIMDFKYVVNDDIRNRVYLVMPFVRGGTLMQVVWSLCPPIRQLIVWFAQLTAAIEYVHSKGIIHCDIKPANCLVGTDGRLKLTDFGLSKVVGYDERGNKLIGTLAYLAPETIVKRIYTPAVDWWSLGVTIYECVAHNILFTGETRNMIMRNILIADEAHVDGHVSRLEDLVTGLLSRKRKLRLGMNGSVKDHPFFKTVKWETLNIDEALVKPPPFIPSYKHSDGKSDHDRSNARKLMERELFYGKEFPLDHQLNYRMDVGTSHGRSSSKGVTHGFLTRSAQTNKVAVPIFEDGEVSEDDDDPKSAQTSNMTTMEAGISITN
eukprot:GSChrysophyteH1.ASY1.ANO1.2656.1 assembled CDS